MTAISTTKTFTTLQCAAARLGLPAAWLRAEADAGRVPVLRAGRQRLFNVEDVERALVERARQQKGEVKDDCGQ